MRIIDTAVSSIILNTDEYSILVRAVEMIVTRVALRYGEDLVKCVESWVPEASLKALKEMAAAVPSNGRVPSNVFRTLYALGVLVFWEQLERVLSDPVSSVVVTASLATIVRYCAHGKKPEERIFVRRPKRVYCVKVGAEPLSVLKSLGATTITSYSDGPPPEYAVAAVAGAVLPLGSGIGWDCVVGAIDEGTVAACRNSHGLVKVCVTGRKIPMRKILGLVDEEHTPQS